MAAHGQAQAQLTSAYKLRLFGPYIAGPNFVLLTCIVKSSQSAARQLVGFRCKYIGVNEPEYVSPSTRSHTRITVNSSNRTRITEKTVNFFRGFKL